MRYVILRDDDTNALTPVECLERLYRPFLDRRLPVNLAVIPDVALDAVTPEGKRERFLWAANGGNGGDHKLSAIGDGMKAEKDSPAGRGRSQETMPIGDNERLVRYLRENAGYRIVQHGCHHDYFEFDRESPTEISERLERGLRMLTEAGFPRPVTFVAPHDKFSRVSYRQVSKRFRVISSGWFELRRLPLTWWPSYLAKRTRHAAHWHVGRTVLLSHPGCLLSANRNLDSMFDEIVRCIEQQQLTVLVTHWWEYFRDGEPEEEFIRVLHRTADYLASQGDIKVISFADLAQMRVPLN